MKYSRSFTLIELLAVIVILGVLMTLLAPAALAVKRQTTLATSSSALRQLSIAAQTYLGENNGRFFRSRENLTNGVQWWFGFESFSGPKTEGQRLLDKSKAPSVPTSPILQEMFQILPSHQWGPASSPSSKTDISASV